MGKKRTLSPEHLAKLQAGREAAKKLKDNAEKAEPILVPDEQIAPEQNQNDLEKQVQELKAMMFDFMKGGVPQNQSGVQQNAQGAIIGTFEKYVVDPSNYPNPSERLSKEPKLAPFAFEYNYELDYQVHVSQYDTKDGRNVKEPRFMMELRRVVLNDDGTPTNGRYIVRKLTFHEDPQAAIQVARANGLEVDDFSQEDFLNEMRYIRARDWLLGIFYPPLPQAAQAKKQVVIDNQVVDMITVNSENASAIPFDQISTKLRT